MKKIFTYLIAITALLLMGSGAMAQSGTTPFLNSTHTYRVTMEDGAVNTDSWYIADAVGDSILPQPAFTATVDVDTAFLEITWLTIGDFKIVFTETDGSGTFCSTAKSLDITVIDNTFDVTISDSTIACNDADGVINFVGPDTTSVVTFTVDTVGVDWDYDWEIRFTLTPEASLTNVAGSFGNLSGAGTVGDPYILTNIPGIQGSVDITMEFTGNAFTQQTVLMEIISAQELNYNTSALLNENTQATSIINAIPNTSDIQTD